MPEDTHKSRKKIIVEEVKEESVEETPKVEVTEQTEPHIEPGIHEEPKAQPKPQEVKDKEVQIPPASARIGPSPFVIIIPGVFLLGALLGGIIYYQKNISATPKTEPTATTAPQATASPTASPSASVDLEKYEIKILNGSGIAGEAGKAEEILDSAGFKVSSTGNASNYSYTKTIIQVSSEVDKAFIDKLIETLSETYEVDSKTQALPSSSSDEVVVIVGKTKK